MLGTDHSNFFFEQKRQKRFQQRRVRKFDEAGERRDGITFLIGDREGDAVSVGAPSLKLGISRRVPVPQPETASRKVSYIDPPSVKFPPIDPSGPNLVTAPQFPEEADSRSVISERKLSFFQVVEAKIKQTKASEKETPVEPNWSQNEAKFASTGILSKLGKVLAALNVQDFETEITLPKDLVEALSQDHDRLVTDTLVEKREWQTNCYLDYETKNTNPFLTGVPEQVARTKTRVAVQEALEHQQQHTEQLVHKQKDRDQRIQRVQKHVRMSNETKNEKVVGASERPQTARSVMSNFSLKSERSSDDGRESTFTTDYDRLPLELRPSILNFRHESQMPKLKKQTRLEKMQSQVKEKEEMMKKAIRKEMLLAKAVKRPPSAKKITKSSTRPSTARPSTVKQVSKQASVAPDADHEEGLQHAQNPFLLIPKTTINFSVEKTSDAGQVWLVHPSDAEDPESHTLRMWDKRLKELHRKREESLYMDKNQGADKPMVVKFYNEPHIRSLRTKHQRSATVPLPALLSKLPPSLGSFSSPTANEAMMIGEGVKVFVLTMPDGSGHCNYTSGQQAISQNRCDKDGPLRGSRGLYTLVLDDVERSPLLAYFTPTGKACCYYRSGAIHMLSDSTGGCLYSEEGVVTRKWEWPPPKLSMPVTISLYLNVHISLRCTSLTNMDLRISSRGHSYKFPVGPSTADLENAMLYKEEDLSRGSMQSTCHFISRAAKSRTKYPSGEGEESDLEVRRKVLKKKKGTENLLAGVNSDLQNDGDKFAQQLDTFKDDIQTIVNDWMKHYCSAVGITDPSLFSRPTSRADSRSRGMASRGRMVKSSMDYTTGLSRPSSSSHELRRTRSLTHPFSSRPSSRPISPFKFLPEEGMDGEPAGSSRLLTPLPLLRPESPLDYIQPPSPNNLHDYPFKAGKAKSTTRSASSTAIGCPIALHNLLWRSLDSMPSCKCDKRRIPYICDLEYDVFLLSHVPRDQLIIVCVTSSLKERSSYTCEPMIDAIYTNQNRLRYSPCKQGMHDKFRLVKYDIASARLHMRSSKDPEKDKPLLVGRHNASPGMFLMYLGGKLVHADYMFNGYSNTRKDFMKHVHNCIQQGKKGKFMPYDFKFTRHTGTKILGSNTWAYPVSGFMQDLVLFSPQSNSQSTSRGPTPALHDRRVSIVIDESEEMETDGDFESTDTASQLTLSCSTSMLKVSQTTVLA